MTSLLDEIRAGLVAGTYHAGLEAYCLGWRSTAAATLSPTSWKPPLAPGRPTPSTTS